MFVVAGLLILSPVLHTQLICIHSLVSPFVQVISFVSANLLYRTYMRERKGEIHMNKPMIQQMSALLINLWFNR